MEGEKKKNPEEISKIYPRLGTSAEKKEAKGMAGVSWIYATFGTSNKGK